MIHGQPRANKFIVDFISSFFYLCFFADNSIMTRKVIDDENLEKLVNLVEEHQPFYKDIIRISI